MNDRTLTVSSLYPSTSAPTAEWRSFGRRRGREPVPFLRLTGRWMEAAGFGIGEKVRVRIEEEGRLVVERER